jgi:hypothetical protein
MHAAATGFAEEENPEGGIDQQDIFYGVILFLPAITVCLCSSVLGADDASFRPVMGKRGDIGAAAGTATTGAGSSSSGTTTAAAAASATPSRCGRAARERVGALPRVRSVASSAGKRM